VSDPKRDFNGTILNISETIKDGYYRLLTESDVRPIKFCY